MTIETGEGLEAFLNLCLDRATFLRVYFPGDPFLGRGRDVFARLSQATLAAWEGMADCEVVSAPLDFLSRELVRVWMVPTDARKALWQYELLTDDEIILRTADFSDHMVHATEADLLDFQQRGIEISHWEAISLQGTLGCDIRPDRIAPADDIGAAAYDIVDPEPEL